ncbi:unnamed protein product [Blepharisma stoltei]|uniref:PiggyBac transposable element-derived protein 4 C-terminal zinc-ribbon domain-containing protein n=1 Tax=Blepharisma stoltei TaxID=1481888 RepID=A0AAU9KEJ8_9CILI|nr:unnamed protein product [Blepharisma stoltei]
MKEFCEDKITVFSGMYSLIFNYSEDLYSLRLPNIFFDEVPDLEESEPKKIIKKAKKGKTAYKKKITACPHKNKRHYARNMCNNCYHKSGRVKRAWACPHQDRQLYAKGVCQFCYLQCYHKSRSLQVVIKKEELKV